MCIDDDILIVRDIFKNINKQKLSVYVTEMGNGDALSAMQNILSNICIIKNNFIEVDIRFFLAIATVDTYGVILEYIKNVISHYINNVSSDGLCVAHVCMKDFTVKQLMRHSKFITGSVEIFTVMFCDNLKSVYLHNSGFIFEKLISLIGKYFDKDTMKKIIIVHKSKYING
jgi:hypothetical protein